MSGDCEVFLDLLDVEGIKDMGIHSWIQEKIELAQFVVILCSTGARFKCAKNRQFKMKQEREVTFYIAHILQIDSIVLKTGRLDYYRCNPVMFRHFQT